MAVDAFIWFRSSSAVTGFAGGKNIHVMLRPVQGGATPPPGSYDIHPPVQDPIYGMVALMVPSAASGSQPIAAKTPSRPWIEAPAGKIAPAAYFLAPAGKIGAPAMVPGKVCIASPSQAQVFVMSHNPIPGRNSIVVSSGFADLMDALQAAGGVTIQVI